MPITKICMLDTNGHGVKINKVNYRYREQDISLSQFANVYGVTRQQCYRLWDAGVFDQCKADPSSRFSGGSARGIDLLKAFRVLARKES